jgi:protein-S-isoprenylcysteine O-methyltransferase Ste14
MKYVILVLIWILWCTVHSLLISAPVTERLKRRLGNGFRFYRIVYNAFSAITLIPVVLYSFLLRTEALFTWEGPFRTLQILLLFVSTFLFVSGARHYDPWQFLGIRQVRQSTSCAVLTENCELDTEGILGVIRHPWYLGGMMIVWARDLDLSAILTNAIITGYFVVGAFMEEHKLDTSFGDTYKEYRRKVSMFFPYKWLKGKLGSHG